jgi:phosphomannomutase
MISIGVTVTIDAGLRAAVEAWVSDDPDARDQGELRGLLELASAGDAASGSELADRFAGRLAFGTAGLRGAVGAGPNRMNRAVVRAATAAVAGWLTDRIYAGAPRPVVVGCDARHRSAEFADEAAAVLAGAGLRVLLLPRPGPTPLLAFAVRYLGADAGIMITASHNPAADNGYKLYLGDGAQIIPPVDAEIEHRIARLGRLGEVPVATLHDPLISQLGDEVAVAYLDAVTNGPLSVPGAAVATDASGASVRAAAGPADMTGAAARGDTAKLTVTYTPLHGVAGPLMLRAISRAGFGSPHVVAAQALPNPDFPTVAFPNPEEPGALDLALADARSDGADLVLASDPDGDRLAVAVPVARRGTAGGPGGRDAVGDRDAPGERDAAGDWGAQDAEWRPLTGDQLGALLGAYLLGGHGGSEADADPRRPMVATTIVSSSLLGKIAAAAGAGFAETLTGFKWISRAADGQEGARFVFGYEEALGYEVGQIVRDKDGIGAAMAVLRLASAMKRQGKTLLDRYDDLERAHGVHLTQQLSLRIADPGEVMRRLRATPPAAFGEAGVVSVTDFLDGETTGLPASDVLRYRLASGDRVIIRPSGTEPKIKAYLEIVVEPGGGLDLAGARAVARGRLTPLCTAVTGLLA